MALSRTKTALFLAAAGLRPVRSDGGRTRLGLMGGAQPRRRQVRAVRNRTGGTAAPRKAPQ